MVTYSIGIRDQNGNAARVGYHGLGVVGNRDSDNAEIIAGNIHQALKSKEIENNLSEFSQKMAKYTDENTVAAVVNSYITSA